MNQTRKKWRNKMTKSSRSDTIQHRHGSKAWTLKQPDINFSFSRFVQEKSFTNNLWILIEKRLWCRRYSFELHICNPYNRPAASKFVNLNTLRWLGYFLGYGNTNPTKLDFNQMLLLSRWRRKHFEKNNNRTNKK